MSDGNYTKPLPEGAVLVPGFTHYCATREGRVFSCKLYGSKIGGTGPWYEPKLKQRKDRKDKHVYLDLFRETGKPERFGVHQIIMLCFVGPCPPGQETRHLDGNPENNNLSNLCYGTKKQQREDDRRNGVLQIGEKQWMARWSNDQIRDIRRRAKAGENRNKLGLEFGMSRGYVNRIACGEIWKDI